MRMTFVPLPFQNARTPSSLEQQQHCSQTPGLVSKNVGQRLLLITAAVSTCISFQPTAQYCCMPQTAALKHLPLPAK